MGDGGGAGGPFLIEFPDNTEINLTPVKFEYSPGAVLCRSPIVIRVCVSTLSLARSLPVSAAPRKHY